MSFVEWLCLGLAATSIILFWALYGLFMVSNKNFNAMRGLYRSAEKSNAEAIQLAYVLDTSLKLSEAKVANLQNQLTIQQTQLDGKEHYDAVRRHHGGGHVVTEVSFVSAEGVKSVIAVHDDEVLPYPVSFVWIDQQINEHRARRRKLENPWHG